LATLLPDASARAHTFDGLADDIINYALRHARTVTARRGETITRQGDPALQILVVREGYAKLVSTSAGGHDVLVGIAGPRDAFGHAAMAGEARDYLVTSTALTAFSAAAWDRDKALAIAREFPEVRQKIDAQLIRNVELVLGRLHTVSEGRVSQRLARALLELADRHGQPDSLGIMIEPPLTRQDIAAIVATTLFTASRLLSEWENKGLVESSRARVRVRNVEGLRLLASE
jgi:CRP/FNR family transcriptional regulator, nitrogen oxide reductase regulator